VQNRQLTGCCKSAHLRKTSILLFLNLVFPFSAIIFAAYLVPA